VLLGLFAALVVVAVPSAAAAQEANSLQSIEPADGTTLEASPSAIVLAFNQEIGNDDVPTLSLVCGNNEIQDVGSPEIDIDGIVVTWTLANPVPRGTCFVNWFLRDEADATIAQGTSTFAVTTDPPVTTVPGDTTGTTDPFIRQPAVPAATAASDDGQASGGTGGAIWLGRLLSTLAIMVVFGGLTLISVGWPEGPEYVITVRFLRGVWIAGLVGTVLFLVAYSADFNGSSFGAGVSPGSWFDLYDAGWEGRGALLRFVFVVAMGWVVIRPERIIDPVSAMWAWAIPGAAIISVAMGRVDGPAALLGLLVGIVHVAAAAVWFGGAALVAYVVLAGPGEEDLVQATRSFSRISMPAIFVALLTGVIQMVRLDGGELFTSNHGRVVILKAIVVAAMLAVSLAARQQVTMRLDRAHEMTMPLADRFRRAFGAEAALGVIVLAFSSWLLALTPAGIDEYADEVYLPALVFNDQASGLEARVLVGPGTVGPNGLRVEVDAPEEGITNLLLRFIPPPTAEGADAFVIEQSIPLSGAGTAILLTAEGLPFNVAGTWTLQLSASTAVGVLEDATTTFLITEADGSVPTIPPAQPTSNVQVEIVDPTTTTAPLATLATTTTVATTPPSG
jgi:copper transport protein